MPVIEGLKPVSNDLVPVDPNVHVPDHVRRSAEAAEALHKRAYEPTPADPAVAAADAAAAEAIRAAEAEAARAAQAPADQQVQPVEQHQPLKPEDQNVTAEEWRHRFLSMQGRFNQAQKTNGAMEQQMTELGQELMRTQQMVANMQPHQHAQQQPVPDTNHNNLITEEDRANYGDELIDLARRAAMSSVSPELERLKKENETLTQRVQTTGRRELFGTLDSALPQWRAINNDARFKTWLRLPNVYTGQLRGNMLKAAVDGAQAPKVLALFKDFLAEATATGQMAPAQQVEQQATQQQAPHQPAVALETLAAPGRARPASGDSQVPSEKPIYSRAQISKFYDDVRRQLYAGREAEKQAIESDLTAAQREGRIR